MDSESAMPPMPGSWSYKAVVGLAQDGMCGHIPAGSKLAGNLDDSWFSAFPAVGLYFPWDVVCRDGSTCVVPRLFYFKYKTSDSLCYRAPNLDAEIVLRRDIPMVARAALAIGVCSLSLSLLLFPFPFLFLFLFLSLVHFILCVSISA